MKDPRVIPSLLSRIMAKRKVQTGPPESRVNLLSYPVTVEDVRATVKGMASGRAGGPDSLTYEMFQAVLESDAALRVLTDGISVRRCHTVLTPEGMADSRISRT